MKEALLQCTNEELEAEDQEKSTWSGKTIYELLRNRDPSRSLSQTRTDEHDSDVTTSPINDVIVGHCLLDHDLTHFEKSSKNDGARISEIIMDGSSSSLRAMERGDSGEEEQQLSQEQQLPQEEQLSQEQQQLFSTQMNENNFAEKRKEDDRKRDTTNIEPETQVKPETQLGSQSQTEGETQVPPVQDGSGLSTKAQLCPQGGETQLAIALTLFEHPAILAACYCLACLHQLTGLDFVTSLGVILAMISMVSMFFF